MGSIDMLRRFKIIDFDDVVYEGWDESHYKMRARFKRTTGKDCIVYDWYPTYDDNKPPALTKES